MSLVQQTIPVFDLPQGAIHPDPKWHGARDATAMLDRVSRQLRHEPTVRTRNRKPLETNPVAPWELRIGHLRVYFDVEEDPEPVVKVRAVGLKDRNRILIGGEEVELR